ncbi:hypothetical protein [Anabaena catenula]|uniref:Uncharacterized protein n=1 Tax=Anabaena catenula FACHB-362 TaxID=2692877 RepID=A0ABR8J661_9NOST|nr:hypothetical protein [Anabaena catenula]MBD2693863.1 hypothetical protein [Anabaena catenula FACHB-362]
MKQKNRPTLFSEKILLLGDLSPRKDWLMLEEYIQQEAKFVKYRIDHPARTKALTWIVEPLSRLLPEKTKKELLERLYKENIDDQIIGRPIWINEAVNILQFACCIASTLQIQAKDLISALLQ